MTRLEQFPTTPTSLFGGWEVRQCRCFSAVFARRSGVTRSDKAGRVTEEGSGRPAGIDPVPLARGVRVAVDKGEAFVAGFPAMEAATQPEFFEFPVMHEKTKARSWIRRYLDASVEHGTLCTQAMAGRALGVSRSRVGQLLDAGKLASVNVGDTRFIPATALELFLTEERPNGRPRALPAVLKSIERKWPK